MNRPTRLAVAAAALVAAAPLGLLAQEAAPSEITWEPDLETALEKARTLDRALIIDFWAEWCGWCKKLDRETFGEARVIRIVRDHFIAVRVDGDKEPAIQREHGVTGLPTVLILSPQGEELQRLIGFRTADVFLEEVQKSVSSSQALKELRRAATESPGDIDAQRAYARALFGLNDTDAAVAVLRATLERSPGEPGVLLDLADVLRGRGELEESRTVYEQLLSLPDDDKSREVKAQAYLPLGRLLVKLDQHSKAVPHFAAFIAAHPVVEPPKPPADADPGASLESGLVKMKDDPNRPLWEAYYWRGYCHAVLKDPEKALVDLRTVREKDSGPWGLRANYILEIVAPQ